jgi:hypothetical protein
MIRKIKIKIIVIIDIIAKIKRGIVTAIKTIKNGIDVINKVIIS